MMKEQERLPLDLGEPLTGRDTRFDDYEEYGYEEDYGGEEGFDPYEEEGYGYDDYGEEDEDDFGGYGDDEF